MLPSRLAHHALPPTCCSVVRADTAQILHYRFYIGVSERDNFHVHHRLGKATLRQHVADIVHVSETADVVVSIHTMKGSAQLFKRIRTEGAEHD